MNISRIIEVKGVTSVYVNYCGQVQIDVDGGTVNIDTDHSSLRRIADAVNSKIKRQDEELADSIKEAAQEAADAASCDSECGSGGCCQSES